MARKLIMALAALSLATVAFAGGQAEQSPGFGFQGDKLTLKGTVSLQSFPNPILKTADKQYVLMVPPYLVDQAGVKDGTQVTVQGYQLGDLPRYGWAGGNDKGYVGLFVTQATVGGKDYDLIRYYGPMMIGGRGFGRWHGMMGGYGMMGRGYGPGYGRDYGMGPWGDWDDR